SGSGSNQAVITYHAVVINVPVVTTGTFSFDSGAQLAAGQIIGTMTATHSPTSWAITAGNSATNFAINNTGVITLTANGVTNLSGQAGTVALTVQATNANGSGTGAAIISYQVVVANVPVVTAAAFTLDTTAQLSVAQSIGTMTASNSPTSWSITAGNSAGN